MCGRSVTFRLVLQLLFGAVPQLRGIAPAGFHPQCRWGRAATAHQAAEPRKPAKSGKRLLVLLSLTILTACQAASSREPLSVSARTLADEYQRSTATVRGKYDGKEIIVSGYAMIAATMPREGNDQGSVLLEDRERGPTRHVACWFSKDQAEQFAQIKGGQYLTVKGIFNGEAGADLKFCKVVKVE
jgi:hypothetical protein